MIFFNAINYSNIFTVQMNTYVDMDILFLLTFHLFVYLILLYNQSLAVLTSLSLPSVVLFLSFCSFLSLSIHPCMTTEDRAATEIMQNGLFILAEISGQKAGRGKLIYQSHERHGGRHQCEDLPINQFTHIQKQTHREPALRLNAH